MELAKMGSCRNFKVMKISIFHYLAPQWRAIVPFKEASDVVSAVMLCWTE